jgi:hypothetical protein
VWLDTGYIYGNWRGDVEGSDRDGRGVRKGIDDRRSERDVEESKVCVSVRVKN